MKVRNYLRLLLLGSLTINIVIGCASSPAKDQAACNIVTVPASYKVYLYMSKEHNPNQQIMEALEGNSSYALLQLDQDVKIVSDLQSVGTEGLLLTIDIIGNMQGGVSKRIDIRYELTNVSTKELLLRGKDALSSKLGYNKITIKMGKNIARNVTEFLNCIKKRGSS